MTDWNRLMQNSARGGSFVGRGMSDEDAYYAAFELGGAVESGRVFHGIGTVLDAVRQIFKLAFRQPVR